MPNMVKPTACEDETEIGKLDAVFGVRKPSEQFGAAVQEEV